MLIYHKALIKLYFSLIVKSSLNQPVLSNEGKVSCSRKQLEPLKEFKLITDQLRVRRASHYRTCCDFLNIGSYMCCHLI